MRQPLPLHALPIRALVRAAFALAIAQPALADDQVPVEYRTITIDDDAFVQVDFEFPFQVAPIVVAKPMTADDVEPATVMIKNVTTDGCEIAILMYDYNGGVGHAPETVSFFAVEPGRYTLNGAELEAGNTTATGNTSQTAFSNPFAAPPVVITSVVRDDNNPPADASAVVTRNSAVTAAQFSIRLQEQEGVANHPQETIHFLAWSAGAGTINGLPFESFISGNSQTHTPATYNFATPFQRSPAIAADMQTIDGGDPANLRITNLASASVELIVSEDQASNAEQNHTTEVIGYAAVEAPVVSLHDGADVHVLPALQQDGSDIVISFRVRNASGNAVEVVADSLEYFDPDLNDFVDISNADLDLTGSPFSSAADLSGDEHEIVWQAGNEFGAVMINGLRVRMQVREDDDLSSRAISPAGFVYDSTATIFAHDGTTQSVLPQLTRNGNDVVIRFRAQHSDGDDVEVDGLQYFSGPNPANLMPINLNDIEGELDGLESAVDLSGPEHQLIWHAVNDPNLTETLIDNFRVQIVLRSGVALSPPANTPTGFTLNTQTPDFDTADRSATEDIPFLSSPITFGNPQELTFTVLQLPGWLTFNVDTGQLSGTPTNRDVGRHVVVVDVAVNDGVPATTQVNVDVQNVPPQITSTPTSVSLRPGDDYIYDVQSDDEDGLRTTYALNEGPEYLTIDLFSGLISGTVPDDFTGDALVDVLVNDGNGGTATQRFTLNVQEGPLVIDAGDAVTIAPGDPALLEATVSGGRAPYTVFWSNGDEGETTVVEPDLTTAFTAITIDADNRTAADQVTVRVTDPLEISIAGELIVVDGETTMLQAVVSGGIPPYEITWSTGETGREIEVSPDNLTTVTVTVIDAQDSGAIDVVDLESVAPLTVAVVEGEASDTTGVIALEAVPTGGLEPYDVFWSTGESATTIEVSAANVMPIVVVVRDSLGQFAARTTTLDEILTEQPAGQQIPDNMVPCGLCGSVGFITWTLTFVGLVGAKRSLRRNGHVRI